MAYSGNKTYKELLEQQNKETRKISMIQKIMMSITSVLCLAIHIPMVGRLLMSNFTVICFILGRLRQKNNYDELYKQLIKALSGQHFRKHNNFYWWYLMRFAVAITQERQVVQLARNLQWEEALMALGNRGPRPLEGYDVAYVFVGYSLWAFERGDVMGAISMVQIAIAADNTWGYPEYLLGWYGLFTTGVDSVMHFTRAVKIDWSFLQRMKRDKTCQQYPDIMRQVQKKILV